MCEENCCQLLKLATRFNVAFKKVLYFDFIIARFSFFFSFHMCVFVLTYKS